MSKFDKFFSNSFEERAITSVRLSNFAGDVLNRLIVNNTDGNNTALINLLTPALTNIKAELGESDTALGLQKGKTLTVNQFIKEFREFIRHCEGAITFDLGGTKTPAFLEFFPSGFAEYTRANKTQMPKLLNRLKVVATKHGGKLDAAVAAKLMEFESTWQSIRDEQAQQIASLSDNRSGRREARSEMEAVLTKIMYAIGTRHTHNEEECLKYFNFNLLYGQGRKKKDEKEEAAA